MPFRHLYGMRNCGVRRIESSRVTDNTIGVVEPESFGRCDQRDCHESRGISSGDISQDARFCFRRHCYRGRNEPDNVRRRVGILPDQRRS